MIDLMRAKKVPGDPRKSFIWRGVRFDRNTDRRNHVAVDFRSQESGYWWIHPYEVRESGPYGGLTGDVRWVAHTPLAIPATHGCFAGRIKGHGTTPRKALEDALSKADEQAAKSAIELVKASAMIAKLKEAR